MIDHSAPRTQPRNRPRRSGTLPRLGLAALSGLVAAGTALAFAELAAALTRRQAGPVVAVGGAAIDLAPPAVKEFAVRHFGTDDKLVLQLGIVALLALFALVVGMAALRSRVAGCVGVLLFGVLGAVAAASRPDAHTLDPLPSVLGAVLGCGALWALVTPLAAPGRTGPQHGPEEPGPAAERTSAQESPGVGIPPASTAPALAPTPGPGAARAFDRRGFLLAGSAVAGTSALAGALARALEDRQDTHAADARNALTLPPPTVPALPVPAGADLHVPGVAAYTTPNNAFYRVDTALVVPRIDARHWRLRLHGRGVPHQVTLSYADLLRRRLVEHDITLTCVSNEVGGPYVGNARWLGVSLADLLREAGVRPPSQGGPADQLVARSVDGMTIGTPVETVLDGRAALLAVGMNGEPLPFAHGYPVRMVVPGLYGYVSACKWLVDLELTTFADYDPYWVKRSWAPHGPIKTQSRIDTPTSFADLSAGTVPVAGVAWAQHTGVDRVEVRVDGGDWHLADLAVENSVDTWRQWVWRWPATPGSHVLEVRATDRTGHPQTGQQADVLPDGATGWHSVAVRVD